MRIGLNLRLLCLGLPGRRAEEAGEGVEVAAANRDDADDDDACDRGHGREAARGELAARNEHDRKRRERGREAEDRCDRARQDHPERAARRRDSRGKASSSNARRGERDDADEERCARQRSEVGRREKRSLPAPDRPRQEDVGAEELRDAHGGGGGAPERERPDRQQQVAPPTQQQRHGGREERVFRELRRRDAVRSPRVGRGVHVPVPDGCDDPDDEEARDEP